MKVCVQVDLRTLAADKHLSEMRDAAERVTDDKQSVRVSVLDHEPRAMLAEFTMPKARQMDVVDKIMHEFALFMEDYKTQSVWFPHPPRNRSKRKPNE